MQKLEPYWGVGTMWHLKITETTSLALTAVPAPYPRSEAMAAITESPP